MPVPKPPSPEEVEAREVSHFPAKAWCSYCQRGKRRRVGHRRLFPEDKEKGGSLVQMEYMFLKSTGESTTEIEEAWSTTLVVVTRWRGLGLRDCS